MNAAEANGIGLAVDEVLMIAHRSAFRSVADAIDRHGHQCPQQASSSRLLGETECRSDLYPGIASQFVVAADHQVRNVVSDLDRGSDTATCPGTV